MAIEIVKVSKVKGGMIVANDIYSFEDQLIISAGTELNDKIIQRLKFYNISEVQIQFPDKEVPKVEHKKPENTYIERVRKTKEFKDFSTAYASASVAYKVQMNKIVSNGVNAEKGVMVDNAMKIIGKCNNPSSLLDMLQSFRQFDDMVFIHSMNVAMIAYVIGSWLKMPKEDIDQLIFAGLVHDIGKLTIDKDILNKKGRLTDEEFAEVKNHVLNGYNIVKEMDIDERVKLATFMHHERCDGSGYPLGIEAAQIDEFAKIIAIADVYDAMTCPRPQRGPICPFDVINKFETEGLTLYDPKYLLPFMQGVVQSYVNASAELSNGETAEIVYINKTRLARPVVKVGDKFIDTSVSDIKIVKLL